MKRFYKLLPVWLFILAVLIPVVITAAQIYALVSTCGWLGLFIECRIVEIAK